MFPYTKELHDRLKFRFPGDEKIEKNYSQAFQDLFVLAALRGKKYGYFLEIGAFHPHYLSNTYLLESEFEWGGLSVDIKPDLVQDFTLYRKCNFMLGNALELNWDSILPRYFGERIDYLSLDIEPNTQTLDCLKKLPLDKFRFSVITYETDFYDPYTDYSKNFAVRRESREIFAKNGYTLVAGNLSNLDDNHPYEDWYFDKEYFSENYITDFMRWDQSPWAAHKYMLKEG